MTTDKKTYSQELRKRNPYNLKDIYNGEQLNYWGYVYACDELEKMEREKK